MLVHYVQYPSIKTRVLWRSVCSKASALGHRCAGSPRPSPRPIQRSAHPCRYWRLPTRTSTRTGWAIHLKHVELVIISYWGWEFQSKISFKTVNSTSQWWNLASASCWLLISIDPRKEIESYFWAWHRTKSNMKICFPSDQLQFAGSLILNLPLSCLGTGLAANVWAI